MITEVIAPPEEDVIIDAPQDVDGRDYTYEVVLSGGVDRQYGHTLEGLLTSLIDGYDTLSIQQQWEARLHYATTSQVIVQAHLTANGNLADCSERGRVILSLARAEQPSVATWDEPIPLVAIATAYEPAGTICRPGPTEGREPNVFWIDPSDDETLLLSLHDLGFLTINIRAEGVDHDALP